MRGTHDAFGLHPGKHDTDPIHSVSARIEKIHNGWMMHHSMGHSSGKGTMGSTYHRKEPSKHMMGLVKKLQRHSASMHTVGDHTKQVRT